MFKPERIDIGEANKLVIHYKNGKTWTVKEPSNIVLLRSTSGGYNIRYDMISKHVDPNGVETSKNDVVRTYTSDVVKITLYGFRVKHYNKRPITLDKVVYNVKRKNYE